MTDHKHADTSRSGDHNGPEQTFRDTERNLRDRIEALQQRVGELEEALRPFAFLEMEKDEGLADTQYVWEVIYQDRVQDWIAYEHIAAARKALGDTHD